MEEEYRAQKAAAVHDNNASHHSGSDRGQVIMEDGSVRDSAVALDSVKGTNGRSSQSADDDASIRGMTSPGADGKLSASASALSISNGAATLDPTSGGIPVIKVSSESDVESDSGEPRDASEDGSEAATHTDATGEDEGQEITIGQDAGSMVEKPVAAAANEETEDANGRASPRPGENRLPSQDGFSFNNKRLCERWLDNLFMVLYEVC